MFGQILFSSDQSHGAQLQLLLCLLKIYIKNESINICPSLLQGVLESPRLQKNIICTWGLTWLNQSDHG